MRGTWECMILKTVTEAVTWRCFVKKVFLQISQNLQENTCARVFFLNFVKKEAPVQVFSCEFCESFKNTFLYIEQLQRLLLLLIDPCWLNSSVLIVSMNCAATINYS